MVNTNLTCLQGEIHIGFYDLVDMFGEPEDVSSTGKSDVQWAIEIDGVVATIYNWKNGPAYTGDDSIEVERIHRPLDENGVRGCICLELGKDGLNL